MNKFNACRLFSIGLLLNTHLIDIDRLTLTWIYGFLVRKSMISKINVSPHKLFESDNSNEFFVHVSIYLIPFCCCCCSKRMESIEYKIISILSNFITFYCMLRYWINNKFKAIKFIEYWIWLWFVNATVNCAREWIIIIGHFWGLKPVLQRN